MLIFLIRFCTSFSREAEMTACSWMQISQRHCVARWWCSSAFLRAERFSSTGAQLARNCTGHLGANVYQKSRLFVQLFPNTADRFFLPKLHLYVFNRYSHNVVNNVFDDNIALQHTYTYMPKVEWYSKRGTYAWNIKVFVHDFSCINELARNRTALDEYFRLENGD